MYDVAKTPAGGERAKGISQFSEGDCEVWGKIRSQPCSMRARMVIEIHGNAASDVMNAKVG
jgi:hypothetical protein